MCNDITGQLYLVVGSRCCFSLCAITHVSVSTESTRGGQHEEVG